MNEGATVMLLMMITMIVNKMIVIEKGCRGQTPVRAAATTVMETSSTTSGENFSP